MDQADFRSHAQAVADAMVADTGGFAPGDRVFIRPLGLAAWVCAVFAGKALCYLCDDDGTSPLSGWVPVGELERRP